MHVQDTRNEHGYKYLFVMVLLPKDVNLTIVIIEENGYETRQRFLFYVFIRELKQTMTAMAVKTTPNKRFN